MVSLNWVSRENGNGEDKLIITPKSVLECCSIYTQQVAEGKGALVVATKVFLVGLGTQVVDA